MKVGYVPEHFSTPLFFAQEQDFYKKHGIEVEFVPFPSGSGHMIEQLKEKNVDICIGLTEAFVAGIGKGADWYKIAGTYVESPLCWAISTGYNRSDMTSVADLKGARIGVSRIGSGSYVMPFVLAQQKKWSDSFEFVVQGKFQNLRDGVNHKETEEPTDAFMWEYFTTKKYYDSKEIKQIGEIYTPWPSWVVTAATEIPLTQIDSFLKAVDEGIAYFNEHPDEAVEHITAHLDYSADDAREWLKTVKFISPKTRGVDPKVIDNTVGILKAANVLQGDADCDYVV